MAHVVFTGLRCGFHLNPADTNTRMSLAHRIWPGRNRVTDWHLPFCIDSPNLLESMCIKLVGNGSKYPRIH